MGNKFCIATFPGPDSCCPCPDLCVKPKGLNKVSLFLWAILVGLLIGTGLAQWYNSYRKQELITDYLAPYMALHENIQAVATCKPWRDWYVQMQTDVAQVAQVGRPR